MSVLDPALATGDPAIDAAHAEIFERAARLAEASREGFTHGEVERLLAFLGDYVVSHFAAEEQLMTEAGYPEIDAHRAEHRRFVTEFEVLWREYRSEGPSRRFAHRVGHRVDAWLREHIARTDRALVAFLRDRAAAVPVTEPEP